MTGVVLIEADGASGVLPFVTGDSPGFDEAWVQEMVFAHPELVPSQLLESEADRFVPFCRELPIRVGGRSVYLDVFGATTSGTPVLIECKLWKNPQARREVVGQLLEYSAHLQGMSYEDVVAICRQRLGTDEADPLLAAASMSVSGLDEARFVDRLSAGLEAGDFVLILAGDGIRADVRRVVDQLRRSGGLFRRFGLLELKVARGTDDRTVIVPLVPFRPSERACGVERRSTPQARTRMQRWRTRRAQGLKIPRRRSSIAHSGTGSSRRRHSVTAISRHLVMQAGTRSGWSSLPH